MMKVISLGMGVQSTAMYMMSSKNIIERADHAVFADPGAESPKTYETMELILDWQKLNDGIPIHVTKEKNLYKDILNQKNSTGHRLASIPAFTDNGGMIRRQCTYEYKIQPVIQQIRKLHNLKPRKHMPITQVWLGISLDEIERMKESLLPRVEYYYPLIESRMTRGDCMQIFDRFNFPRPPKSSCVFCPFHSDKNWKDIKDNDPESFEKAIEVDEAIRDMSQRGLDEPIFIHRSCKPLKDVEFADQQELFMCEEGFCGL